MAVHGCSPSCLLPDAFEAPFPQRSRPRLLTKAAYGGLRPAPASRSRGTYPHLSRRLLRHTDVGAPLLVQHGRCEVLVQKVRGDRKGVKAVGGALKTPLLPSPEPILAHQPGYAPAADGKPIVAKFVHHARAAVGPVRKGEGRADMSQQAPCPRAGGDRLDDSSRRSSRSR